MHVIGSFESARRAMQCDVSRAPMDLLQLILHAKADARYAHSGRMQHISAPSTRTRHSHNL
eukprot:20840-Eustigmatos_ZCMA.PRE.1